MPSQTCPINLNLPCLKWQVLEATDLLHLLSLLIWYSQCQAKPAHLIWTCPPLTTANGNNSRTGYTPVTPLFWVRTFGLRVGGRSAARRAVLQPQLPKVAFFGVKNAVFRPETHFSRTSSKKIVPIVTGHQKDNSFVLTHCMAGLCGGGRVHFWPKIDPKNCLFSCYTL